MKQQIDSAPAGRFVVLLHQFPVEHQRYDHWDLMLEEDSKLLTWALNEMPEPGKSISAVALADHRKLYLEYEGPISGDRGSVTRVLAGSYFWKSNSERMQAVLEFDGDRMEIEFRSHDDTLLVMVT